MDSSPHQSAIAHTLQHTFGFDSLRGGQQQAIETILEGRSCAAIFPTGSGKSLCYQLPAILSDGTAIIISPLIALMKNQVDQVRSYSSQDSIAHFLNSSLNRSQIKKVRQDILDQKTKMLNQ